MQRNRYTYSIVSLSLLKSAKIDFSLIQSYDNSSDSQEDKQGVLLKQLILEINKISIDSQFEKNYFS